MSIKTNSAITFNIAIDSLAVVVTLLATFASGIFSDKSDAGLGLLLYIIPILILLGADIATLLFLRGKHKIFSAYYLITRLPLAFVIFRLLVHSPLVLLLGALLCWVLLVTFTLKTDVQK